MLLLESFELEASGDVCIAIAETAERKISRRGGRVPLDTVVGFQQTLADAASLFLYVALTMILRRHKFMKILVIENFLFSCIGSKNWKLQNGEHQFTKVFLHPKNGLYCVLLLSAAFSQIVCYRVRAIPDNFMLYTASMSGPLRPSLRHLCDRVTNGSDKERNDSGETDSYPVKKFSSLTSL